MNRQLSASEREYLAIVCRAYLAGFSDPNPLRSLALRRSVELEVKDPPHSPRVQPIRALLQDAYWQDYDAVVKFANGVLSEDDMLVAARTRPRLLHTLRESVSEHFDAAVRAREPADLRPHAEFFAQLARAIYSPTGQPSALHPLRIREWLAERVALNRYLQRLFREAWAIPLPEFLPVIDRRDGEQITVADAGWPRAAALEFLAAAVGESSAQIDHLSRPSRLRKTGRKRAPHKANDRSAASNTE